MLENPEITIQYSINFQEFVAGSKLAMSKNLLTLLMHLFANFCAPVASILLIAMCLIILAGGKSSGVIPHILPLVFLSLLMSSIFRITWRYSFNSLKLLPNQDPQMTFQAGTTSFARKIEGMGELTWLWSATQGVSQNAKVVIIAVRKGHYLFIPRRVISDAQLARLKQFLAENRQVKC